VLHIVTRARRLRGFVQKKAIWAVCLVAVMLHDNGLAKQEREKKGTEDRAGKMNHVGALDETDETREAGAADD